MDASRRVVLTVVSAILYAIAFPPLGLVGFAWVALTPFLLALRNAPSRTAAGLGALWGVLAAEGVGTWFIGGVARYYDQPLAVGVAFFAGVSLLLAAPFFAAFAVGYAWLRERTRLPPVVWAPALWVALELARARFLVGNPWALLGYSQIEQIPLLQLTTWTGIYGLSFLLVATATALADLIERRSGATAAVAQAMAVGTSVALAAAYGYHALRAALPPSGTLTVALVQGNLDVGTQWRRDRYGANLSTYLRLSQQTLRDDRPDLVVWPESAVTFALADEPAYRAAIGHLFASAGAHLVLGGPASNGARHYNAAYLLAPDATVLDRYDKVHLVPFAEYFPLAGIESLRRRFARVRVFTAGDAVRPFDGAPHAMGAVICFEAMYPELVSRLTRQGATLLLNLTNDGWMGRSSFARQHLQMATLRAVENRRYLVRAGATGISAIIDPYGRIVREIPLLEAGTTAAEIALHTHLTPYARWGDVFAWLCVLASVGTLLAARRTTLDVRGS